MKYKQRTRNTPLTGQKIANAPGAKKHDLTQTNQNLLR
jgi:hypothetical protein